MKCLKNREYGFYLDKIQFNMHYYYFRKRFYIYFKFVFDIILCKLSKHIYFNYCINNEMFKKQ